MDVGGSDYYGDLLNTPHSCLHVDEYVKGD